MLCVLLQGLDVHHIILEDWSQLEVPHGLLFVSMPSLIDASVAPAGRHVIHAFTADYMDSWQARGCDLCLAGWGLYELYAMLGSCAHCQWLLACGCDCGWAWIRCCEVDGVGHVVPAPVSVLSFGPSSNGSCIRAPDHDN